MKIGIVCYPTLGGSGILATELGHALAMRGHEIHFITYEVPYRLKIDEPNIFFHEVEINQYDLFKYPDYALPLAVKIASVASQFDLDILHVHYAIPHATSAYLAKQILGTARPCVITTLHGTDITLVGKDPSYFAIVKYSIENSCGVTAVSKSLCEQTHKYFNIKRHIEVINNFFIPKDTKDSRIEIRSRYISGNEKLLLHSSNFRPVKRCEDVFRIFKEVRKSVKCKLMFLGTGPSHDSLKQEVKDEQLENEVIFLGSSRNIDRFVASADLFLLPSSQESFGLAALEAMAYGVPVIASDVGGLPELIEHGKTGFLSPVGDYMQMAEDAVRVLTNEELYRKMSAACVQVAKDRYSSERVVAEYEKFYEKVLIECGDIKGLVKS